MKWPSTLDINDILLSSCQILVLVSALGAKVALEEGHSPGNTDPLDAFIFHK